MRLMIFACALLASAASAAPLKIATLAPEGSSWMREMRAAGTSIASKTENRVELKFFPGGVMGSGDTVLGHRCTVWTIRGPEGEGEACITAEGVMLRSRGAAMGASGSMVATQVAFGAQDPARFQVPQGYQTMQMPGMPGAPGAPGRPPAR